MYTNSQVMSKVFNDKNINKDERYMFLMFISMIKEVKEEIKVSITTLMESFQTKGKKKLLNILKSLEEKGYIEIIKNVGKTNKYRIIKSYVYDCINNTENTKEEYYEDTSSEISSSYSEISSELTSSNLDTGNDIDSGYMDTSSDIYTGSINQRKVSESLENTYVQESKNSEDYKDFNINKYKLNNNKLYINIFNAWNETNINNEKILYQSVKSAIEYALNVYGEEEIIAAIKNYGEVYYSDYYYDFTWNLLSFLRKPNALKRFLNDDDMWLNYSRKLEKEKKEEEFKINIEDYID